MMMMSRKRKRKNVLHSMMPPFILLLFFGAERTLAFAVKNNSFARQKKINTPGNNNNKKSSSSSLEQKNRVYLFRSSGIKTKRKKPPKWEQEGDDLFAINYADGSGIREMAMRYATPREFLHEFMQESRVKHETENQSKATHQKPTKDDEELDQKGLNSSFFWGDMSVGPILAPKLCSLFPNPTPIQSKTFSVLSKGRSKCNVVIASPTGTGKTLAYLLPLLANTKRDDFFRILIVTPTQELALQIQRVADQIWDKRHGYSSVYIFDPSRRGDSVDDRVLEWTVAEMKQSKAPLVAGTPESLLQLVSYCSSEDNSGANGLLFDNVSTIVLDECDRLLGTQLLIRRSNLDAQDSPTLMLMTKLKRLGLSFYSSENQHVGKKSVRLVCASATVGRTLRRQIMEITGSPSIEKAAELITADDRTCKDGLLRKRSLLPGTILHSYMLYNDHHDGRNDETVVDAIYNAMQQLPPARTLIFPGKLGVMKMMEGLKGYNLQNLNTLRDEVHWDDSVEENFESDSWDLTPIYIVGEKFGRGLDISNISYVFLSAPPSNAAAYTHLAGRTGRGNHKGQAITLVKDMKEAIRLAGLSDILAIPFVPLKAEEARSIVGIGIDMSEVRDSSMPVQDETSSNLEEETPSSPKYDDMSVAQLKDMLREKGLKISGRKSELIERPRGIQS